MNRSKNNLSKRLTVQFLGENFSLGKNSSENIFVKFTMKNNYLFCPFSLNIYAQNRNRKQINGTPACGTPILERKTEVEMFGKLFIFQTNKLYHLNY